MYETPSSLHPVPQGIDHQSALLHISTKSYISPCSMANKSMYQRTRLYDELSQMRKAHTNNSTFSDSQKTEVQGICLGSKHRKMESCGFLLTLGSPTNYHLDPQSLPNMNGGWVYLGYDGFASSHQVELLPRQHHLQTHIYYHPGLPR